MKTILRKTWLIALMLVLGASAAWADDPVYSLTFQKLTTGTNYNSYTAAHEYTVGDIKWNIYGNQSVGDNLRVGGKNTTATNRTIAAAGTISSSVGKVTIEHSGIGNGKNSEITINSITVEGSASSTFSDSKKATITSPSVDESGTLEFSLAEGNWDADSYYRITVNYQMTGANNCYITLNSINFYAEGGSSGGTVTPQKPQYTISYDTELNNGAVMGPVKGYENDVISLTAVPYDGYELSAWNVKNLSTNEAVHVNNNKFTMPAANVFVSAIFGATTDDDIVSDITLGNAFWGTKYTGTISGVKGNAFTENGTQDDISVKLFNGASTSAYITDAQTRCYNNYTLTFSVPEGYVFSKIVFTAGDKWETPTPSVGVIDGKTWTSNSNREVTFKFTGTSIITNVKVSYILGDDNGDSGGGIIGGELTTIPNFIKNSSVEIALNGEPYDVCQDLNLPKDYDNADGYSITTSINGQAVDSEKFACTYSTIAFKQVGEYIVHVVAKATDKYAKTEGDITITVYDPNEQPGVEPEVPVYESLAALVAAGEPTSSAKKVTVTLTDEVITKFQGTGASRKGLFIMSGEQEVEIYCSSTALPAEWVENGTISGTLTKCDWKLYKTTWELCPANWTELTYTAPAAKVLSAVNIAGQPTKTEYFTGESFDVTGLTVSAVYDDETSTDVTNAVEWTITPVTFTTEGTTTVKVTATYKETVSAEMTYTATVTKNPYVTVGNFTEIQGKIDKYISYKAFKGEAANEPIIPQGTGCIRLYQNGGYITISGAKGVKISEVILTTGSSNASTIIGVAIDDAEAPTEGTAVEKNTDFTVSGLSCNSIRFYCLGTDKNSRLDVASIKVKYEREDIELLSIGISGEGLTHPNNRFICYSEFNHDNIVITASYSDGTMADVTEKAEFSVPDMTLTGQQTIHVNYTEGGKTVHNAYLIYVDKDYAVSMYADLARTKTIYRIGETIDEADAVFKGDYKSGRKDVDIETTGHYEWTKPDMTTLGKKLVRVRLIESGDNPTAEYTIYVVPANTIFFESFDKNTGRGGNDDQWSGTIASNNIQSDNVNEEGKTTWTFTAAGGAKECAKFGAGSTLGSAVTPALNHAGSVTVSFKAAAWNSTNEKTTITVSIDDDEASAQKIELVKGEWSDYSVTLNGLTAESKVKFSAVQPSNNRFFLDEILITEAAEPTVTKVANYIEALKNGESGYTLDGLQKIVDEILRK